MGWGVDAMVLTFVAPHALDARPLVLSHGHRIRVSSRSIGFSSRGRRRRPRRRLAGRGTVAEIRLGTVDGAARDAARPRRSWPATAPRSPADARAPRRLQPGRDPRRRPEFGPGLNVLTGETGAGKTIVTGALDLALGGAHRGVAGRPERAGGVRGGGVRAAAGDAGPGGVRRRPRTGRRGGRAARARAPRLGRRPRPRAGVRPGDDARGAGGGRRGAARVVSQHEARALTRPAVQRALLDGFAGPEQADRLHGRCPTRGTGSPRRGGRSPPRSPTRPAPIA